MTPETFFQWAVAIAFCSGIVLFCLPIDRWISNLMTSKSGRLKHLEDRVASLERRLIKAEAQSLDTPTELQN